MKIIDKPTELNLIWQHRDSEFDGMLKIVVDIEQEILAIDAEMHADLEEILIENGSQQKNLWGANVYPDKKADDFIEYTSFINIRPREKNRSMEVQNPDIKLKIKNITERMLLK
ncbi:MAG: hypothetical protein KDF60_19560 [Calditrichaeota bacterium]|nr:hypothetical protein [Calditrichota bacterium]